jgi:hypothetical protein
MFTAVDEIFSGYRPCGSIKKDGHFRIMIIGTPKSFNVSVDI